MIHPNDFDDALGLFLARLTATHDSEDRLDLFQNAVRENGGDFTVPRAGDHWGPHVVELSLFGIAQQGETPELALANWIDAAKRAWNGQQSARRASALLAGDLSGIPAEDLRRAAECVRLYSADLNAIARADRIDAALSSGAIR